VLNWRWGASCDPFPQSYRAGTTASRRGGEGAAGLRGGV